MTLPRGYWRSIFIVYTVVILKNKNILSLRIFVTLCCYIDYFDTRVKALRWRNEILNYLQNMDIPIARKPNGMLKISKGQFTGESRGLPLGAIYFR